MHQEQLNVLDVADEEGLVAGGHHVAGLLVGAISDLKTSRISIINPPSIVTLVSTSTRPVVE